MGKVCHGPKQNVALGRETRDEATVLTNGDGPKIAGVTRLNASSDYLSGLIDTEY
jgi:hypothetical protein